MLQEPMLTVKIFIPFTILKEIEELAHLLAIDYDNDKLDFMRGGFEHLPNYIPRYWRMSEKLSRDEVDEIVRENIGHVVDFYSRFVKSLRSMMEIGKKAGYELIYQTIKWGEENQHGNLLLLGNG